jgi:hypothetical protein
MPPRCGCSSACPTDIDAPDASKAMKFILSVALVCMLSLPGPGFSSVELLPDLAKGKIAPPLRAEQVLCPRSIFHHVSGLSKAHVAWSRNGDCPSDRA